jgi:hypothetical protein
MAMAYHTPIDWWINLPVVELFDWVMIAKVLADEMTAKRNVQNVGPSF